MVSGGTLPGSGPGEDVSEYFKVAPEAPPATSAKWSSPKDGATVSGTLTEVETGAKKCLVKVDGPVSRTENYVDGKLNDTQVYAPWGCVWNTRNYVNGGHLLTVKAFDKNDRVIRGGYDPRQRR